MLILRSALFNILFYLNLLALMTFGLPTLFMGRPGIKWLAGLWGRSSLWLLRVICGTRVEFRGLHHIPEGGVLVAAKHQSAWEVFALLTIFPEFAFVLKRELTRIPLFGLYLTRSQQIAIDRARGRAALAQVSQKAKAALADGRQLLIFPEGTRRPPGAEPQYKFGVALIYAETRATCLPVALNSGLFWPRRSFVRRPGTILVEFLEPIPPGMETSLFQQTLQQRVETATGRLVAEALARDGSACRAGSAAN